VEAWRISIEWYIEGIKRSESQTETS
jgi:hypothetical protein